MFNRSRHSRKGSPFEEGQDIDHIRHAYGMLNERGCLVGIMSEGPFFREDRKSVAFRAWLQQVDGWTHRLPVETFRASGAEVHSRIVVIWK